MGEKRESGVVSLHQRMSALQDMTEEGVALAERKRSGQVQDMTEEGKGLALAERKRSGQVTLFPPRPVSGTTITSS